MSKLALQLIEKEKRERTGKLDLGRCGLDDFWPEELFELTWLEELVMSNRWWNWQLREWIESKNRGANNYFSSIPMEIAQLNHLKILKLGGGNQFTWCLKDLQMLEKLPQLQSLDLRSNQISDYSFLEKLSQLQSLDLSSNQISDYSFLEKLSQLQSLGLSSNQISDIRFLEKLTQLQSLDLGSNQISNISFLKKMTQLRSLYLRSNKIEVISFLEKLPHLQFLDLRSNKITDISILQNLTQLLSLDLSNNQISDISFLEKLNQLQSLDLRSNQISNISFLEKLTQLQHLDLRYNQINDIYCLKNLPQLQTLDLRDNKIKDIQSLKMLDQLQSLDLSYNQIKNIHFLEKLTQLKSLDLSFNQIKDIHFLAKLTKLQSLDLRNNQIENIHSLKPIISQNIPILIKGHQIGVNLYNNPLKLPPPEIVQQGNEAILNYFEQLELDGKDYLFEAKLLILGESGAGKTSFARKIQNHNAPLPEEEETTRGIEVAHWRYDLSPSEVLVSAKGNQFSNAVALEKALQNGFRANLWDFGGQEIYHSTHRFFLSHRSLYILLANARNQDTDFNYWLNIAEQLGGDSPLLVVINEKQGHRWRIDETGLKGRFGFFKELLEVNFGDDSDLGRLERLRNCVKRYLGELPHIGDTLPKSWAAIRRALQEENKPFISFERYLDICRAHGMAELDRVLQLSQYLHDIGVFLHFQHEPVLKNRIFLDANWTTTTVYRLLNDAEVKNNKGRFTLADAKRIWPEAEVQLIHDELLKLLERFNLAYRIEQTDQFITPEHLPEPKPYGEWEYQEDLLMLRYEFDAFMPKGLITELIVALHRYIPDQERVWRKGVVLQREHAWAEIVEAYGNVFRIEIKVAGRDKKELLTVIAEALDRILARFAKLHFEKLVPCNCERCSKTNDKSFYKLSDLKRRLGNRKNTIDCPKNDDKATPIRPMLEETMNFEKDLSIAKVIAKGEIQEAIAILEGRSSGAFKDEATHFRFQLSDLEAEYGRGKIDFDTYRQTRAKVADAILKLDQKMD